MNYLIISPIALSLFIVPRLCKEKDVEKVYFCILDSNLKATGKNINEHPDWSKLEMVSDYNEVINKHKPSDLIVFIDDVGAGETGQALRNLGYKVIGGSPFTDRIEDDRQYATELMSKIMDIPKSTSFTSFDEAIGFVKSHDKEDRLIFKPNDSEVPKEYTYVSKNVADMLESMKSFKEEWKWKEDFQIQEFVKGTEVDFNAFFNGKEYLSDSFIMYFENKPIMNDDIGPATGGSIAVEFTRPNEGVFWDILEKLKPALVKSGYKGQLAINCIVSETDHKPYFLEFCGRVGYPSFPIDITLIEENGKSIHDLFMALANEQNPKNLFSKDKIAVTISIFVPPAPLNDGVEKTKGNPVTWDKEYNRYFFPYYIDFDSKKNKYILAGVSSWVMNVTCADKKLDGAISMLYDDYMPTFRLKNAEYRTDLGKDARERIKKLREWGLL